MERRVSRKVWAKRVERWRESGQTAIEYGAAHGVNADRLRHWGWQIEREKREAATTTSAMPTPEPMAKAEVVVPFVEVQRRPSSVTALNAKPTKPEPVEIITPNGLVVRVPAHFDDQTLRRVLAVVR
jgi:hypothetical protein